MKISCPHCQRPALKAILDPEDPTMVIVPKHRMDLNRSRVCPGTNNLVPVPANPEQN